MKTRRSVKVIFAMVLMTISLLAVCCTAMAKPRVRLNKKQLTLSVGQQERVVLKGAKKAKWSSSNQAVASVNGRGVVTACNSGNAVISAKYKGRKYRVAVTVYQETLDNDNTTYESDNEPVTAPAPATSAASTPAPAASGRTGSGSVNEFWNRDNYGMLNNNINITPYHVYYKNGSLYAECYIINGYWHRIYNINVRRLTITNGSGTVIADASFGVIAGGAGIAARDYGTHTFVFGPACCVQNARLNGALLTNARTSNDY